MEKNFLTPKEYLLRDSLTELPPTKSVTVQGKNNNRLLLYQKPPEFLHSFIGVRGSQTSVQVDGVLLTSASEKMLEWPPPEGFGTKLEERPIYLLWEHVTCNEQVFLDTAYPARQDIQKLSPNCISVQYIVGVIAKTNIICPQICSLQDRSKIMKLSRQAVSRHSFLVFLNNTGLAKIISNKYHILLNFRDEMVARFEYFNCFQAHKCQNASTAMLDCSQLYFPLVTHCPEKHISCLMIATGNRQELI
uniref:Uncharacterized protein n=1 Tax=Glossina pallidipes TaxID=7398 RepID=A0A1B0AB22_GLOPL